MLYDCGSIIRTPSGKIVEGVIIVEITNDTVIWKYKYSDRHHEAPVNNIISINGEIKKGP